MSLRRCLRRTSSMTPNATSNQLVSPRTRLPSSWPAKIFLRRNLNEFVSYLKQNGDKVKEAHGGVGASSHMACLLFNQALDIRPTLVAYRGTAPAMNDLIGGHVDFLCEQSVSVAEQIKAGTVRGYVVSANQRLAALPDVPSAKEGGINYQMSIWAGIFAPKGTPKEIVTKLSSALDKALDDPSVREAPRRPRRIDPRQAGENTREFCAPSKGGNRTLVPHSESCISRGAVNFQRLRVGTAGIRLEADPGAAEKVVEPSEIECLSLRSLDKPAGANPKRA